MTAALDRLPRGSTAISDFSEHIENGIERGWVYGTLMFGQTQVRTGYLMLGMLKTNSLRNALLSISRQFERIKADDLAENFAKICGASAEANARRAGRQRARRRRSPARTPAPSRRPRWASRRR